LAIDVVIRGNHCYVTLYPAHRFPQRPSTTATTQPQYKRRRCYNKLLESHRRPLPKTLESGQVKLQVSSSLPPHAQSHPCSYQTNAPVFLLKQIMHHWSYSYASKILVELESGQTRHQARLCRQSHVFSMPLPSLMQRVLFPVPFHKRLWRSLRGRRRHEGAWVQASR